ADKLRNWIESTLEGWLGLQINRDKTRVVNLWQTGAKLDFLGYTSPLARSTSTSVAVLCNT
ncbi:MAG: hypothetical protein JNK87_22325, partial [Bryobacterales bacterium]|nr:hypothetical protein [Bryobacterales bacterium]